MMNTSTDSTKCARHPKVETGLRCSVCDTPICPQCLVQAPVGIKCPDCARNRTSLYNPSYWQLTAAGLAALLIGTAGGWLMGFLEMRIWLLLLAVPYGGMVGELIHRVSGRRCGRLLELVAGIFFVLGSVGGRMVIAFIVMKLDPSLGKNYLDIVWEALRPFPFAPIAVAIALSTAISRIRYI